MTENNADFLEASLASAEELSGHDNPSILAPLNAVAEFHLLKKNFERAEELLLRAAAIAGSESPANSENVKLSRQKLAWLKFLQGKNDDAEPFFQKAIEAVMADENATEESVAQSVRSLVYFYLKSEKWAEAEAALQKLLKVYEHPKQESTYQSAFVLISMAVVAAAREQASESALYTEKAAAIIKDKCAIGYTVDYLSLSEIINLYFLQERKADALELVGCTMLECEDSYWPHNPIAGDVLSSLAEYMRAQRKFKQAESIYKRAITIKELCCDAADPDLARLSLNLSNMYLGLRKYADAEPLIKNAMKARVKYYGVHHPSVAACVETYATILRKTKRASLANKLDVRAREIRSACVATLDREMAIAAQANKI
jgi:tetratricopeptide (TPR) repeat protein